MSQIGHLLRSGEQGASRAAEALLPLVYDELRKLAAHKLANQPPGQTLRPTALVHEAWLRLAGSHEAQFADRTHFFSETGSWARYNAKPSSTRKPAHPRR